MGRVVIEELVTRLPDARIDVGRGERARSAVGRGWRALPLRLV